MPNRFSFICFCVFLLAGPASAQQNKIVPKKGQVAFSSTNIILDETLYNASTKAMQQKLVDLLKKKLELETDQIVDTGLLHQFFRATPQLADLLEQTENEDSYHVYEKNFVKSFKSRDGRIPNTYFYINKATSNYVMRQDLAGGDSTETDSLAYEYETNREVTIKEFRDQQKVINGYSCFKVIYQCKDELEEDEELGSAFKTNDYNIIELWVTEEIQSMFHPKCRIKEVLAKYYPLEINERPALVKGYLTVHKLKSITLSN